MPKKSGPGGRDMRRNGHKPTTHTRIRMSLEDGGSMLGGQGMPEFVVDPGYNVYGPKSKIKPRRSGSK